MGRPSKKVKKKTFSIVFWPGIRDALEKAAKKDRRSVSSYLEKIVIEHFDKKGIPWKE